MARATMGLGLILFIELKRRMLDIFEIKREINLLSQRLGKTQDCL